LGERIVWDVKKEIEHMSTTRGVPKGFKSKALSNIGLTN
jgi:hypothetical protein